MLKKMKRKLAFILVVLFSLSPVFLGAQDRRQDREKENQKLREEVRTALADQQYLIKVDWAIPMSGKSINLTYDYQLEVNHDSVRIDLPFFGRAYSLPYGEGGGFHLDAQLENYTLKEVEKRRYTRNDISFEVKDQTDRLAFNLIVTDEGAVTLSVNSNRRAPISYRGILVPLEESDKD